MSGKAWRNELFQIPGLEDPQVGLERSGSFLFGVVTFGVHCTGYVEGKEGLKIWAPRRARTKPTYGGMLDNTVAGGMAMGDDAFTALVKEASEEASLPAKMVRDRVKACATVSYFHIQAKKEGEESGLLQPTCKYVYDLELPASAVPHAGDDEVEGFKLLTIDQVKQELEQGKFRPSSTLVLLDFLIRHGVITADNEKDYADIIPRLHRRLPFPTNLASAAKLDGVESDADKEKCPTM